MRTVATLVAVLALGVVACQEPPPETYPTWAPATPVSGTVQLWGAPRHEAFERALAAARRAGYEVERLDERALTLRVVADEVRRSRSFGRNADDIGLQRSTYHSYFVVTTEPDRLMIRASGWLVRPGMDKMHRTLRYEYDDFCDLIRAAEGAPGRRSQG
jgi:hypothetical protein